MESARGRELPRCIWQGKYYETITEENVESCYTFSVLQKDEGYKDACVKVICENLRVENCIRFLNFSKEVNCDELLATVRGFILKNIEEVKSRRDFLDLLAGTVNTLLVPITTLGNDADEPKLEYSPSALFISLYEWMTDKRHQRVIKFDQILESFPLELVDVDVLEKVMADNDLQRYQKILMMFFAALLKKYRKHMKECKNQRKVMLGMEKAQTADAVLNHSEPKVEAVSTSTAFDNGEDIRLLEVPVTDVTEPALSVTGSAGSFNLPSAPENDDLAVIFIGQEIQKRNSKAKVGVKTEATDSASMPSGSKVVRETLTSVASDHEGNVSVLDVPSSDPALSVAGSTRSKVSFETPSTLETDDPDVVIVDEHVPTDWLSEVIPKVHPYFPQIGDDLVYFRQGHERYMLKVAKTGAYTITCDHNASLPYKLDPNLPAEVSVRLTNIAFKNLPPRVAILTLERTAWYTRKQTGVRFKVFYHFLPNVNDFLVLREVYDHALKRRWKNGDRFRSLRGNFWRTGEIIQANVPFQSSFPNSHYLSFLVAWDSKESCQGGEPLCPWELDLIRNELPKRTGANSRPELSKWTLVLREELIAIMREIFPRKSEWQDTEIRRISSLLDSILKLPTAARFLSLHDLEFDARIDYPVTLWMIKARLDNSFYRSKQALLADSEQLAQNVLKCFPPDVATLANVFNLLIREIVSDGHTTWESLEKRYNQLCHEGIIPVAVDSDAPGVSKGRRFTGDPAPAEYSLAVGAANSSKPVVGDSRKRRATQGVQLSSVSDPNKSFRTYKSSSIPSRQSDVLNRTKVVFKKTLDGKCKKRYECDTCGRQYNSQLGVKEHMYKHTGERPYVCSGCPKSYPYQRALREHETKCKARKISATQLQ